MNLLVLLSRNGHYLATSPTALNPADPRDVEGAVVPCIDGAKSITVLSPTLLEIFYFRPDGAMIFHQIRNLENVQIPKDLFQPPETRMQGAPIVPWILPDLDWRRVLAKVTEGFRTWSGRRYFLIGGLTCATLFSLWVTYITIFR